MTDRMRPPNRNNIREYVYIHNSQDYYIVQFQLCSRREQINQQNKHLVCVDGMKKRKHKDYFKQLAHQFNVLHQGIS
jgi:transposase-like protein